MSCNRFISLSCVLLLGVVNGSSLHMKNMTSSWPRAWKNDVVFMAVTDDSYLKSTMDFIESLTFLGYELDDIVITSVTVSGTEKLSKQGVKTASHVSDICEGKKGCLISESKIVAIINVLKANKIAFYLDLDVFIKSEILSFIPSSKDAMVIQYNTDQDLNFGCFIVRPDATTIDLFECMLQIYRDTRRPDQTIFSDLIMRDKNITYSIFDRSLYINRMFGIDSKSMPVVVHMTCVEGVSLKRYMASSLYGEFNNPKDYSDKTVSAHYNYKKMSFSQTVFFIEVMAKLSKMYGRVLRIIGDKHILPRIFSAEKLSKVHVRIVEATYWESHGRFYSKPISRRTINVSHVVHAHERTLDAVDDVEVQFPEEYWLRAVNRSHESEYVADRLLCSLYVQSKGLHQQGCLKNCDGVHWFGT